MKRYVDGDAIELTPGSAQVVHAGDRFTVRVGTENASAVAIRHGDTTLVSYRGRQYVVSGRPPSRKRAGGTATGELRAPMPGQIVDIRKAIGDSVKAGEVVVVLEAMKTQQPFSAPFDGIVADIPVEMGQQVADGSVLAIIKPILLG